MSKSVEVVETDTLERNIQSVGKKWVNISVRNVDRSFTLSCLSDSSLKKSNNTQFYEIQCLHVLGQLIP